MVAGHTTSYCSLYSTQCLHLLSVSFAVEHVIATLSSPKMDTKSDSEPTNSWIDEQQKKTIERMTLDWLADRLTLDNWKEYLRKSHDQTWCGIEVLCTVLRVDVFTTISGDLRRINSFVAGPTLSSERVQSSLLQLLANLTNSSQHSIQQYRYLSSLLQKSVKYLNSECEELFEQFFNYLLKIFENKSVINIENFHSVVQLLQLFPNQKLKPLFSGLIDQLECKLNSTQHNLHLYPSIYLRLEELSWQFNTILDNEFMHKFIDLIIQILDKCTHAETLLAVTSTLDKIGIKRTIQDQQQKILLREKLQRLMRITHISIPTTTIGMNKPSCSTKLSWQPNGPWTMCCVTRIDLILSYPTLNYL